MKTFYSDIKFIKNNYNNYKVYIVTGQYLQNFIRRKLRFMDVIGVPSRQKLVFSITTAINYYMEMLTTFP